MSVIVNSVDTTVRVRVDSVANKVIAKVYQGRQGPTGPAGASGGSTNAWKYKAKTTATSGYPGNGFLLWNNATQTSATSIIVSHLTDDDTDIELFLSFFVINQKIFIQDRDDSSKNQVWQITGTPTVTGANTSTAYYTFPVTLVSSAGAAFTNNHSILFGQIVVATNSVTSATTSDGTCDLAVDTIVVSTTEEGTSAGLFVSESGYGVDALSTNFVGARITSISGKIISGNNSTTEVFAVSNAGVMQATGLHITGTSFTYGTGAATAHVTALGLPAANTIATLAGSETLTNKTLTSPAINSATFGTAATFNATTYTYGAGAAAAHRDALGVAGKQSKTTTSAVTSTSGTPAEMTDLTGFSLEANATYRLTIHAIISTSSGGSFEFVFDCASTTYLGGSAQTGAGVYRSGGSLNGGYHYNTTRFSPLYATQNLTNGHTYGEYYFRTSGTAGTAKMQFSQRPTAVSGTTTVADGATVILEKIS